MYVIVLSKKCQWRYPKEIKKKQKLPLPTSCRHLIKGNVYVIILSKIFTVSKRYPKEIRKKHKNSPCLRPADIKSKGIICKYVWDIWFLDILLLQYLHRYYQFKSTDTYIKGPLLVTVRLEGYYMDRFPVHGGNRNA